MLRDNGQPCIISDNGHPCIIMSGQWTDLVMAVRIIDKDITQVVQVPRLSSRVLFLTSILILKRHGEGSKE